jgi:Phosphatidylinositol-4-phosphate 5-Kinase
MSSGDTSTLEDIVTDYAKHLECVLFGHPRMLSLTLGLLCCVRTHPSSLLCKFYLCIKMTIYKQDVVFVVMENVFPPTAIIQERYDLKVCVASLVTVLQQPCPLPYGFPTGAGLVCQPLRPQFPAEAQALQVL